MGNQKETSEIRNFMPRASLKRIRVLTLLVLVSVTGLCRPAKAQETEVDDQLSASHRLFKSMGPGLRALRRGADGKYYLLASPGAGLVVFDAQGRQLSVIGAPSGEPADNKTGRSPISLGEDCDLDGNGAIYIADGANNLIKKFSPDGKVVRTIPVKSPISVVALPGGEVGVSTLQGTRLVSIYGADGQLIREFGELEDLSARPEMNRYLSLGRLGSDSQGRIYYGYSYLPEPRVRQYDHLGRVGIDFEFTGLGSFSEGRATRKEIERQEDRVEPPFLHPVLTAFGIDPINGDVWMCLHNTLLHFDKDGIRRSEYQIYTPAGARLEATVILVEEDRLLIGSDPLGVFEFHRPDRKQ
jgi:hypothetical protein